MQNIENLLPLLLTRVGPGNKALVMMGLMLYKPMVLVTMKVLFLP